MDDPGCDRVVCAGPVLSAALYQRFTSRGEADFADRLLSAMRFQSMLLMSRAAFARRSRLTRSCLVGEREISEAPARGHHVG